MNVRSFESNFGDGARPHCLRQHYSHRNDRVRAAVLLAFGASILAPFVLIAADITARAHFTVLAASQPFAVAQFLVLASIGLAGVVIGCVLMAKPKISKRLVRIDDKQVRMLERAGAQIRSWSEPMAAFSGIRHKVMTTSDGPLHAVMLEHSDRRRSFPVAIETHISDRQVWDLAKAWNLPVLASDWVCGQDRAPTPIGQRVHWIASRALALKHEARVL